MAVVRHNVTLDSEGIPLVGAFFTPDAPGTHPALVICHGLPAGPVPAPANDETPLPTDDGLSYPDLAILCAERGLATLIFNFRGTGQSGGNYHPLGWAHDLEAVLAWMWDRPEVDVDRVAVLGSSMGARVAIWVTARRPEVAALVSFAAPAVDRQTMTAEERVRRARELGIIRDSDFPPSVEAWHREMEMMDPAESVARVAPRPLLIMHGEEDDVVSPDDARVLYERAHEPKELIMLPKTGHRFRSESVAIERALDWLGEHLGLAGR